MKVIVAGPRNLVVGVDEVVRALEEAGFEATEIVSGGAPGVDRSGEECARLFRIPVQRFPADWKRHGKAAGPIRNRLMAHYADALVVIRRAGELTRGTSHMEETARSMGLPVHIHELAS